jgi:hypothetical protein
MRLTRLAMVVAVALGASAVAIGISSASAGTELTGTLSVWHGDDFAHQRVTVHDVFLDTGTRLVPVDIDHSRAFGENVRLRGTFVQTADGERFVPTSTEPVPAAVQSAVTAGTRKTAVVLLNFTNDRTQPWTPAQVHGVMVDNSDSVSNYYAEASNGQTTFSADVFGWYALNLDNSGCTSAAGVLQRTTRWRLPA